MESFVLSENTDQYKALLWRQFYHSEKDKFFGSRNKLKTIFWIVMPVLFFLAYWGNGRENNLFVACFFSLRLLFTILLHFVKRSDLKKEIAIISDSVPYTITLSGEGVTYMTAKSLTELKWSYFLDYEEFEGNFTLYKDKLRKRMIYLPLSLAPNNESLINLVRQKVKARET